jgi:dynein heavy chain 1
VNFWDVLKHVTPLRNELKDLEVQAGENRSKADQVLQVIVELEKSIARYKEEYTTLISQAVAIKADLSNVEAKVSLNVHQLIYTCFKFIFA